MLPASFALPPTLDAVRVLACLLEAADLSIRQQLGDHYGQAASLNNLGVAYLRLGRYTEAIACQQESLAICRELGDRQGEANNLNNLGVIYLLKGRHGKAIACQQDSLAIFREVGDRYGEAESLWGLGDALRAVGRDLEAGSAWQEGLAICEELHIPEADGIRERLATLLSGCSPTAGRLKGASDDPVS
jgi:tetratricopeptide (TPR) repeat protein